LIFFMLFVGGLGVEPRRSGKGTRLTVRVDSKLGKFTAATLPTRLFSYVIMLLVFLGFVKLFLLACPASALELYGLHSKPSDHCLLALSADWHVYFLLNRSQNCHSVGTFAAIEVVVRHMPPPLKFFN
jgi:hypothetical protein